MGIIHWLVVLLYACLMLGVRAYNSQRNHTADDFLLGGRTMSPIALGLSLFATLISTLSYLGNPGEMNSHGAMMMPSAWPIPLFTRSSVTVERFDKEVNLLTAPLFVLFFLTLFVKQSNPTGAWLALISSIATAVSIVYSKDLGIPLTISFFWMSLLVAGRCCRWHHRQCSVFCSDDPRIVTAGFTTCQKYC